jgi:hypothetical protein
MIVTETNAGSSKGVRVYPAMEVCIHSAAGSGETSFEQDAALAANISRQIDPSYRFNQTSETCLVQSPAIYETSF